MDSTVKTLVIISISFIYIKNFNARSAEIWLHRVQIKYEKGMIASKS